MAIAAITLPGESWALLQSCNVSATSLPFGTYDPASGTATDGTGTITVTCVALVGLGALWDIKLSAGGALSYSPRQMSNGAVRMSYNIYTNTAHTTVWGDGSGSTATVSDSQLLIVGSNVSTYTMYGRIPALQDLKSGPYSDSIVVTITY